MKSVLIIDKSLPIGVCSNVAAILGMTMGKTIPDLIGHELLDGSGNSHPGITTLPLPVIGAAKDVISFIRRSLTSPEYEGIHCVGFPVIAQSCRTYEEYAEKLAGAKFDDIAYLGIGLYGRTGKINQLTGGLRLLGSEADAAVAA
ncbi:MAG TPA: DUF2000 domain-containing protein [Noviherbaspirillum sp.]